MAARKWSGRSQPSFLLAPKVASDPYSRPSDLTKPLPLPQSLKFRHRRFASDCTATKAKPGNSPGLASNGKAAVRSTSPRNPFNDLDHMLDLLCRKLSRKSQKWAAYGSLKQHCSPVRSPKPRKSLKELQPRLNSPRISLPDPCSKVNLQYEDGTLKTPKLYKQQIFRDVFDETGKLERILYSSDEDSAMEIYQTDGEILQLQSSGRREPISEYESECEGELEKVELGAALLKKLQNLQNRSQSDTACEECRDSHKPFAETHS